MDMFLGAIQMISDTLRQAYQTGGPLAACSPIAPSMQPATFSFLIWLKTTVNFINLLWFLAPNNNIMVKMVLFYKYLQRKWYKKVFESIK